MKKVITLILALVMIAALVAGCTNGGGETTATPAPNGTTQTGNTGSSESIDFSMPFANGKTYTVFANWDISSLGIDSYNENPVWKELAKRTGVTFDWTHAANGMASEQFSLSLASEQYPDMYFNFEFIGGYDYYIDNEVITDLTDYMKYAPNYDRLRRVDQETFVLTITNNGRVPGFFEMKQSKQFPFVGPVIRQDFLDKAGLSMPQTYDQLHSTLVTFKDQLGIEVPFALNNDGIDEWLMEGFDTLYGSRYFNAEFYQQNGVVTFGPATENFKEYVKMLRDWYAEGLIDKDYYTRTPFEVLSMSNSAMPLDKVGAGRSMYTALPTQTAIATNPDFHLVAMPLPTKNEGDTTNFMFGGGNMTYTGGVANVITTACDDVETLVKTFNYFYSDEGSLLMNYGFEGESFEYGDDGIPHVTELLYGNPDKGINAMLGLYTANGSGGPWNYDWKRELRLPTTTQDVYDCETVWLAKMAPEMKNYSALTVAQDDTNEYNAIMGDISTLVTETVSPWIIGQKDIDAEWDTFQANMKGIGIDRAIAMQQAAYDQVSALAEQYYSPAN